MALFIAEGLIGSLGSDLGGDGLIARMYLAMLDWYRMQRGADISHGVASRLGKHPALGASRAPGMTCMSALGSGVCGSIEEPINHSKGCGGIMRVAPVALFTAFKYSAGFGANLGAESSAITHGHELGYIPSAFLVYMLRYILTEEPTELIDAVKYAIRETKNLYPRLKGTETVIELVERAVALADSDLAPTEAIALLGEGWVAEETLAIAVYSVLKARDFRQAVIIAANHSGDSDSTAAVAGNIMGAHLGASAIPDDLASSVELSSLVSRMAHELYFASL
jgi:ADP-ribosylglycohydrolase